MIRVGHVIDHLRTMPEHSVQCVVTSPPYYGLRDYGLEPVIWEPVRFAPMPGMPGMPFPDHANQERFSDCRHEWDDWQESHDVRETATTGKSRTTDRHYGNDASRRFNGNHQKHSHGQFCRKCGAWRGCLGLEPDPNLYIGHLVQVFREVRRVLRKDGTLWLNLGDSFASGGRKARDTDDKLPARGMDSRPDDPLGIKPKDMMGIPWRAAFALQADGWWLRSDVIWEKPNAMPESVTDRPTRSHEMIFLLTPSCRYFYDHIALREAHTAESVARIGSGRSQRHKWTDAPGGQTKQTITQDLRHALHPMGRNRRDVWTVSTKPYHGAHFAVFPPDLVEPMIRAGTSEAGACPHCGKAWVRTTERVTGVPESYRGSSFHRGKTMQAREPLSQVGTAPRTLAINTTGWAPGCHCEFAPAVPCVVLDPFGGSGTTAMVAQRLGRQWEVIDANPNYAAMAEERLLASSKNGATRQRSNARRSVAMVSQLEIF